MTARKASPSLCLQKRSNHLLKSRPFLTLSDGCGHSEDCGGYASVPPQKPQAFCHPALHSMAHNRSTSQQGDGGGSALPSAPTRCGYSQSKRTIASLTAQELKFDNTARQTV